MELRVCKVWFFLVGESRVRRCHIGFQGCDGCGVEGLEFGGKTTLYARKGLLPFA